LKIKTTLVLFFMSLPFALVLRLYQYIGLTDPQTGFYFDNYAVRGNIIFAVFIAVAVLFAALSRTGKLIPAKLIKRSLPLAVGNFFMTAVMLYQAAAVFLGVEALSATDEVGRQLEIGGTLLIVLALLSAVYFGLEGRLSLTGAKSIQVLAAFPVIYGIVKLAVCFIRNTGLVSISENLYDIIFLCFTVVFLLLHSRLVAGIDKEHTIKWVFGIGLATAMFGIICSVPRIFSMLFRLDEVLRKSSPFDFVYLGLSVYIMVFLIDAAVRKEKLQAEPAGDLV